MNQILYKNLTNEIKSSLPSGVNVANFLMEILSLGKEAAYRRMRGEVPFSFEEIFIISRRLNISLDKVLDMSNPDKGDFTMNVSFDADPMERFLLNIQYYTRIIKNVASHPKSLISSAHNSFPYAWYFTRDLLSRFMLYKWVYQREFLLNNIPFSKFYLPEELVVAQRKYLDALRGIKKSITILDRGIFSSLVKDIAFLKVLGLLDAEDISILKKELREMLDDLEVVMEHGQWGVMGSAEIRFYLSEIDFDNTYGYLECEAFKMASLRIFSIETICSQNQRVSSIQKSWIDSLMQHSTLISQSATIQRAEYFEEQRKCVDSIVE